LPEPSASNKSNASRISVFCSSVNSGREVAERFLPTPVGTARFACVVVAVAYFSIIK